MDLKAKIEAAKAALEAEKAKLTDEDRSEIEARKELDQLEGEREAEERKRIHLDLDRRLMAAETEHPDKSFASVSVEKFTDTFVIQRKGNAHGQWIQALTNAAANGKNADRLAINRKYACQVIYDWNGETAFDTDPELTNKLNQYLIANPGLLTPITNEAARLNGVNAEERKSGT
jgi:hypothetical protein